MSFRKYGGTNFKAKNNYVNNNYQNSTSLNTSDGIGKNNTIINYYSDISGNIKTTGDIDIDGGDLIVSGKVTNPVIDSNGNIISGVWKGGNIKAIGGNIEVKEIITLYDGETHGGSLSVQKTITSNKAYVTNSETISGIGTNPFSVMPKQYIDNVSAGNTFFPQSLCAVAGPYSPSGGTSSVTNLNVNGIAQEWYNWASTSFDTITGISGTFDDLFTIDGVPIQKNSNILITNFGTLSNSGTASNYPAAYSSGGTLTYNLNTGIYNVKENDSSKYYFERITNMAYNTKLINATNAVLSGNEWEGTIFKQTTSPDPPTNGTMAIIGINPWLFVSYQTSAFETNQGLYTTIGNTGTKIYLNIDPKQDFLNYLDSDTKYIPPDGRGTNGTTSIDTDFYPSGTLRIGGNTGGTDNDGTITIGAYEGSQNDAYISVRGNFNSSSILDSIGNFAIDDLNRNIKIGSNITFAGTNSIALGHNVTVSESNTIQLGDNQIEFLKCSGTLKCGGDGSFGGALTITEGLNLEGGITTSGTVSITNATNSSSTTTGALKVTGGVGIGGNVNTGGDLTTTGIVSITNATNSTSTTTGALKVTGGVGIGENLYIGGDLTVTETSSGSITLDMTGIDDANPIKSVIAMTCVYTAGNFIFYEQNSSGDKIGQQYFRIDAPNSDAGNKFFFGNHSTNTTDYIYPLSIEAFTGNLTTSGIVSITNATNSTSTTTGALKVTGGVGIAKDLYMAGTLSITTAETQGSNSTIHLSGVTDNGWIYFDDNNNNGQLYFRLDDDDSGSGYRAFKFGNRATNGVNNWPLEIRASNGDLTTSGSLSITNATNSSSTTTGALKVTGGVGIGENVNIGGNLTTTGTVSITNATNSTSTSTGALQVTGGVGIAKDLYIGANGTVSITNSTNSTSKTTGALKVSGGVGVVGNVNAAAFYTTSDRNQKENIIDLDDRYHVDDLRPVEFNFKEQDQKQLGFIAQEVEEIYPFFVSGTDTKSLNYNNFIGILVKEMKDLKKRVTELETKKDI